MQKTLISILVWLRPGKLFILVMRSRTITFRQGGLWKLLRAKYSKFSRFGKNPELTRCDSLTFKLFVASELGGFREYFCLGISQQVDFMPSSSWKNKDCLKVANSVLSPTKEILWLNSIILKSWNSNLPSRPSILSPWRFNVLFKQLRLPWRRVILLPQKGQANEWGLGEVLFCGNFNGNSVPS